MNTWRYIEVNSFAQSYLILEAQFGDGLLDSDKKFGKLERLAFSTNNRSVKFKLHKK